MIVGTLNSITVNNTIIESIDQFSDNQNYTNTFKNLYCENKSGRIYIAHKIESSKTIREIKYGSRNCLSNIFDTLVKNNTFLSHRKSNCHKEYSIGFFANINSKGILKESMHECVQDHLMFIDIDDEDKK